MKKPILAAVIFIFIFAGCAKKTPDSRIFFQPKPYGGNMYDSIRDITSDKSGFYFAGMTTSYGSGGVDAWIGMISPDGKIKWQTTAGGPDDDRSFGIAVTKAGLMAACGFITLSTDNKQDGLLAIYSDEGKKATVKNFGGTGTEEFKGIASCSDGGLIMCGTSDTFSGKPGVMEGYIVKTDEMGNEQWSVTYGKETRYMSFVSVTETAAGYAVAGRVMDAKRGTKAVIVMFDRTGKALWEERFGSSGFSGFNVIIPFNDGLLAAGEFDATSEKNAVDAWLVRTDIGGKLMWDKKNGWLRNDRFDRVLQTKDKGILAVGLTESYGSGASDIYAVRCDSEGNSIWAKYFGGRKDEYAGGLVSTGDIYAVAGWSASYGIGEYDGWITGFDDKK